MIIGCCGAGKSTLSRALSAKTGLPLYHLDQYYWRENWQETPKEEWRPIVQSLTDQDTWIIDGNYGGTFDIRIPRADVIIYLDYPTWKCFYRVIKRIAQYHGKVRPDMPKGCKERFNFEFLHYVATYKLIRGKSIHKKLEQLKQSKEVIVLSNDKQVEDFLSCVTTIE